MASSFNWLSQIASITQFSVLTVPERKGSAATAAFGTAGVVFVLVWVLSIAQGFRAVMKNSGDPSVAMVMRSGSDSEMMSVMAGDEVRIIGDFPGVVRNAGGPLASAELFVVINLPKKSTGTDANVPLRGVEPAAFLVHEEVQMSEGRRFETGRNEIIVGRGAAAEFAGLGLGSKLRVGRNEWTVVGIFTAKGGIAESEIWTDAAVLQQAYQRGNSFQAICVRLSSPQAFQQFTNAVTADPRLNVKVIRQTDYYLEQSRMVYNMVTVLGVIIASLMALGAIFGALITMYTAVASRVREIATLRALGFNRGPVVVSVLAESLLLSLAGGVVGGASAYLAFNGFQTSTMNFQSFSQVTFAFDVTPPLLMWGIVGAGLIGLVGGLFPAIRAARLPIAAALREL